VSRVDPTALDWGVVRSATARVRQHYRYVYSAAVHDLKQRLIMIPPDRYHDQVLESWSLDVRGIDGACSISWENDGWGNRVCHVEGARVEHAVDFEAVFRVERRQQICAHDSNHAADRAFLEFTALTAPNDAVRAAARDIRAATASPLEQAELAHDWSARSIAYEVGVTGTRTPAAMALHLGRGVCQDFAHIMLSLLRTLGLPCRYISGHLLGEGAPHAWVEVMLPSGAVTYDPTHHRRARLDYLTVAVGRDFADVTMTSGVFTGAATGRLHWSKQAELIQVRPSEAEKGAAA
jgi:transglutaminase-like putative cysteine protease